jgi:hypothetical protein
LRTDGEVVGGLQNDIVFDNRVLDLARRDCVIYPAIGLFPLQAGPNCLDDATIGACKNLSKSLVRCGGTPQGEGCPSGAGEETSVFRAIIVATAAPNNNAIPDGPLYSCTFDVIDSDGLPIGLIDSNVVVADPFGLRLETASMAP